MPWLFAGHIDCEHQGGHHGQGIGLGEHGPAGQKAHKRSDRHGGGHAIAFCHQIKIDRAQARDQRVGVGVAFGKSQLRMKHHQQWQHQRADPAAKEFAAGIVGGDYAWQPGEHRAKARHQSKWRVRQCIRADKAQDAVGYVAQGGKGPVDKMIAARFDLGEGGQAAIHF